MNIPRTNNISATGIRTVASQKLLTDLMDDMARPEYGFHPGPQGHAIARGLWDRNVMPHMTERVPRNVLDVCCGSGRSTEWLTTGKNDSPDWSIYALDGSVDSLLALERRFGELSAEKRFGGSVYPVHLLSGDILRRDPDLSGHFNPFIMFKVKAASVSVFEAFHEIYSLPFIYKGEEASKKSMLDTVRATTSVLKDGGMLLVADMFGMDGHLPYQIDTENPAGMQMKNIIDWVLMRRENVDPEIAKIRGWGNQNDIAMRSNLKECLLQGDKPFKGKKILARLLLDASYRLMLNLATDTWWADPDIEVHVGLKMDDLIEKYEYAGLELVAKRGVDPEKIRDGFFRDKLGVTISAPLPASPYGAFVMRKPS